MTTKDKSSIQKDTDSLLHNNIISRKYGTISEQTFTKHVTEENALKQQSLCVSQLECGKQNSIAFTSNCSILESCSAALVVNNDGSTARDNFALERTFLSWLRASAALMLTGFSIYSRLQLIPQSTTPFYEDPHPIGILLIFSGVFVLIWAVVNYFQFQIMLKKKIAVVENGKVNFFVIAIIGTLIFMALFINMIYASRARENTNDEPSGAAFLEFIYCWG
ncbi:23909_t:CDS:2, partial [Cetraspora pellucida]